MKIALLWNHDNLTIPQFWFPAQNGWNGLFRWVASLYFSRIKSVSLPFHLVQSFAAQRSRNCLFIFLLLFDSVGLDDERNGDNHNQTSDSHHTQRLVVVLKTQGLWNYSLLAFITKMTWRAFFQKLMIIWIFRHL